MLGDGSGRSTCTSASARCSAGAKRSSRRAGPAPRGRDARRPARGGGVAVRRDRLPQRGHRRVPRRRRRRRVLLHRDEHADPGRAPGDRAGHRHRPRRRAAADRRRRAAAAAPGGRHGARLRARAAHQRRGPGEQLHAQPGAARARGPARGAVGPGRHVDGARRRGAAVLRLAARQGHRVGPGSPQRARAGAARAGRARRPGREDDHAAARRAARRGLVRRGRVRHRHARGMAGHTTTGGRDDRRCDRRPL